ncbi:DUF2971 domain-containing protein [Pontibacter sp. BAB1700]|uniref:DUF2971 domain-containing protein n=1 Tax=Pontibacter sp. BAB1700 TaxID=1144253 RepID=UPI00178C1CD0|nr:DUF2971 domain-containing protein [Pontibacter sp. BAB1700]
MKMKSLKPEIRDISEIELKELEGWGIRSYDEIIYKYVSYDTFYKIIENGSLYYSTSDKFNDPFDSTNEFLDFTIDNEKHLEKIGADFFFKFLSSEGGKNSVLTDEQNNELLSNLSLSLSKTFEELKGKIGISCFSKHYNNQLMWSHYADKHKGVCIGFKFKNFQNYIQKSVGYFDSITPINQLNHEVLSIYKWLFAKSRVWSYENEIRRIKIDQTGLIPFEKDEIVELYFGISFLKQIRLPP